MMNWETDAAESFVAMPIGDSVKESIKLLSERRARKRGADCVTTADLDPVKRLYFKAVPEAKRNLEYEKRIAEGETDLRERMARSARAILDREIDLFKVELCHAQYFRCISQNIEVRDLKKELEARLCELGVTELIADLLPENERLMAHHRLSVAVSGCVNGCTMPELRPVGVAGAARPEITDAAACDGCYICVDPCRRNAIMLRRGVPEIDARACDHCGNCIKFCPHGVYTAAETGYRIWMGGKFGRFHQNGYDIFKIADKATLLKSLEALVGTIREAAATEESVTSILNRVGIAGLLDKCRDA
jgi:dissimilatory sulfite reductase (desulfoviridin) alpha/beta subunit